MNGSFRLGTHRADTDGGRRFRIVLDSALPVVANAKGGLLMESELDMVIAMNNSEADTPDLYIPIDTEIYAVFCQCGWFGMSDDCQYGRCPSCGGRVQREAIHG